HLIAVKLDNLANHLNFAQFFS
ncbi:MAG: hypothetical protein RIR71_437, partial [Actinomycetota bacterium]